MQRIAEKIESAECLRNRKKFSYQGNSKTILNLQTVQVEQAKPTDSLQVHKCTIL